VIGTVSGFTDGAVLAVWVLQREVLLCDQFEMAEAGKIDNKKAARSQ